MLKSVWISSVKQHGVYDELIVGIFKGEISPVKFSNKPFGLNL